MLYYIKIIRQTQIVVIPLYTEVRQFRGILVLFFDGNVYVNI